MAIQIVEYPNLRGSLPLRVAHGHFATSHSHINYYIDLTMTKHRLSEAREAAKELCSKYLASTVIDTILCLDGTEVIGACMASRLSEAGFMNMNAHRTIYVVTPEHTSGSQLIFRDNTAPMIVGKHVLILAASVTTGYTVQAAVEAVRYYSGLPVGISAIYSSVSECEGYPVTSIYDMKHDLPDYQSTSSHDCPLCKAGVKLDAMVNSHGISSF
ncbi:MAG: orotate phosphoribosyltransferase [Clostridia bacterium]|nr:orotate phosphoribosyltransferase [Clostridia bacterium]MBR1684617.1 orotate phosphoribosyltransferase [Clostridia bacterium]